MFGLYDHHAMAWYRLQCMGSVDWMDLPESRKDSVRGRVRALLAGASLPVAEYPGDERVINGRYGDFNFDGHSFTTRTTKEYCDMPRLRDCVESRWSHFYDSLVFGTPCQLHNGSTYRMFGNANVGNLALTNLQVAGQLASDQTFKVKSHYVTVEGFSVEDEELVRRVLEGAKVTTMAGDRPQAIYSAWDLFTDPRPGSCVIPIRQSFSVICEFQGEAYVRLDRRIYERHGHGARVSDLPRLVVHYEGWQMRDVG